MNTTATTMLVAASADEYRGRVMGLFTMFTAGAIPVMLATGLIMRFPNQWSLSWRTGATFVHDWFALGIWVLVLGHVGFALRDGDALEAMMVSGHVPASWARHRAPRWYDEVRDSS